MGAWKRLDYEDPQDVIDELRFENLKLKAKLAEIQEQEAELREESEFHRQAARHWSAEAKQARAKLARLVEAATPVLHRAWAGVDVPPDECMELEKARDAAKGER